MEFEDNLKSYIEHLYATPLLDRPREKRLLVALEREQNRFLLVGLKSAIFRKEFKDLLAKLDLSKEIFKLSRKLDFTATKKEQATMRKTIEALIEALGTKSPQKVIAGHLKAFAPSGTLIVNLVNKIKAVHDLQALPKKRLDATRDFLGIDPKDLKAVLHEIYTNEISAAYHALRLKTPSDKLVKLAFDGLNDLTTLEVSAGAAGLPEKLKEVEGLIAAIEKFESASKVYLDELIQKNLRLVVARARIFRNRMEFEDLIQEGNLGLIRAINKFDSSRGVRLSTFATWWIDQAIRRAISNKSHTVRVPTHVEFLKNKMEKAMPALEAKLGRKPTYEEIAAVVEAPAQTVERLASSLLSKVELKEDEEIGTTYEKSLANHEPEDAIHAIAQDQIKAKLDAILADLPPEFEMVVRLKFGLGLLPTVAPAVAPPQPSRYHRRKRETSALAAFQAKLHERKGEFWDD